MTGIDPLVGQSIDNRYEIIGRVGEGGMGVVYEARQTSIDRRIAIKMLNQTVARDPGWIQRFRNEGRACSQLTHPNTIRLIDFGQTSNGRPYMAMEYLDGISLYDAIQDTAPMEPIRVMSILSQCCASLSEAHQAGIIHRDIKPDNVFLLEIEGQKDFVKLLDFSVAKLMQSSSLKTMAGIVFGTPQYMSPEQARAAPPDARSDLYSLGILTYQMIANKVPFDGEDAMTVLRLHATEPLPPLPNTVPLEVRQFVDRALKKELTDRFQTANEMLTAAQQVTANLQAAASYPRAMSVPQHSEPYSVAPQREYQRPLSATPNESTVVAEDPARLMAMASPNHRSESLLAGHHRSQPNFQRPSQSASGVTTSDPAHRANPIDWIMSPATPTFWIVSLLVGLGLGLITFLLLP